MTKPVPAAFFRQEFAAITTYLEAAQDILKSGVMPDITALEKRVAAVCEQVKKAPKDVHEECLPELVGLLEKLNEYERNMRAFHEARVKTGGVRGKS